MTTYQLAKPSIGEREEEYVRDVLRSGTLSLGPYTKRFEETFAAHVGSKYACAMSSGTAGLHVALIAAGVGPGDEVITSPFSFIASSNAILYVGATPVFVDIDPVTYNLDPEAIEEKITPKTKAILPVHIFGQPAKMDRIMEITKQHDLVVVEDACESLDATYNGKKAGTFGQSGVFAFYANKQITTGEGGMLVTDDERIYDLAMSLRNQGRGKDMQWLDHDRLGYNYRMDEMSAALGLAQIEQVDEFIRKRQQVAAWYSDALAPYGELVGVPQVGPDATHTWFVYVVRLLKHAGQRDEIIEALKEAGVQTKPYLPSIHRFSFYQGFGFKDGDFPVSEAVSDQSLALPFHIFLTKEDVEEIVSRLIRILS